MGARGQYASLGESGAARLGFFFGLLAGLGLLVVRYLADFGGYLELIAVTFSIRTAQVLMGRNYEGVLVNVLFFCFEIFLPALATSVLAVALARKSRMPRNVAIGTAVVLVALLEIASGFISLPIP